MSDVPAIVREEEELLARVRGALAKRSEAVRRSAAGGGGARRRADEELMALRDEIGEARLEDVPALVAQMERLQGVSMTRGDLQRLLVDPEEPYFAHLRLRERAAAASHPGSRPASHPGSADARWVERDVLIGRATFVDAESRVNIVDWRNAPVSQLYYRYAEGSDYEEQFGDREVEGEVLIRRTVTIREGRLRRIASPQGIWIRRSDGAGEIRSDDARSSPLVRWVRIDVPVHELAGGQGTATRPDSMKPRRGVLGTEAAAAEEQRLDRHLAEITALIDPRQFDLISAPDSGVAVIQGGAGSGKTTIGLHRLAYLAHADPHRFAPRRMLVVTYGAALAAYMSEVLPALGVDGVRVLTFREWAERELRAAIPWLKATIIDDPSPAVTRIKSHPAVLHELERRAAAHTGKRNSRAVVDLWAELLTDQPRLAALLRADGDNTVSERDLTDAHRIMAVRTAAIVARDPRERPPEPPKGKRRKSERAGGDAGSSPRGAGDIAAAREERRRELGLAEEPSRERPISEIPEGVRRFEAERDEVDDDENVRGEIGIDGLRTEDDQPLLDIDDVAFLLRAHQLIRRVEHPLAHLFVDEAQDLSPMKLAVLIGRTATVKKGGRGGTRSEPSITFAGDTSQKLFLDNGFGDWRSVLGHLGLSHVAIEPLRVAYRSTREILDLARHVMGPLADEVVPEARRTGAPVEAFRFLGAGDAVGFLAEALRELAAREPRATVALIARYPEQADRYFEGLKRAEVPGLRRVRAQEFAFRPAIEVTDVRQVKGLEFDYVVMLDANAASYGSDDEARHLMHIGITRAAHQLWIVVTGTPSPLLPNDLLVD